MVLQTPLIYDPTKQLHDLELGLSENPSWHLVQISKVHYEQLLKISEQGVQVLFYTK